ncbi:MAG: Gx transporter family protein [Candidatus Binatia bacterium]
MELRKIAVFSMLLAMGIVLHIVEGMIPPPLPFPGAKLGLSSIVVFFTMLYLGYREGVLLAVLRSILGGLIGGTFLTVGFFLSLGGATVSALVMALVLQFGRRWFSLIGVSVIAAVSHNVTQLAIVLTFFVKQNALLYYLPFLLIVATVSGMLTGLVMVYLEGRMDRLQYGPQP